MKTFWIVVLILISAACAPALPSATLAPPTPTALRAPPAASPRSPTDTPTLPPILFESNRSGTFEIYAMTSSGRGLVQLTDSARDGSEGSGSPDWSPDGRSFVFSSKHGGDWDLFLMQNGVQTNLTATLGEDDKADWSPDGKQILFTSKRGDLRWADIFVMNADGTNVRDLTNTDEDEREPAWSPNGQEIAYRSFRDGSYDLYIMNREDHAPRYLTKTDPPVWNSSPAWSPDGHWIAFETNRDGNWEIYLTDNNGQNVRNLTNNPADDKEPAWSPDGSQLMFSSTRDGNFELYVMAVASGSVTRLTYNCGRDHNPDWRRDPTNDLNGAVEPTAVAYAINDLNLRGGPGLNYATAGGAAAKDCLTVIGRSADDQWLQVTTLQGRAAWVARSLVDVQGDLAVVPVSS